MKVTYYLKDIGIKLLIVASLFHFSCNSVETNDKNNITKDSINVMVHDLSIFTKENSGIPGNQVRAVGIDNQNNVWIGTFENGIAKYDGNNWTRYDTSNSGLSDNSIWCITTDHDNNIWIGTSNGLTKYDGSSWTVYNTYNSPLPYSTVMTLAVDNNNLLWIGCGHLTAGGILSFDGNNLKLYTKENSLLPSSIINAIYIDADNNKWIGTANGLLRIDNKNSWSVYTKRNSGLLFEGISTITTDKDKNVWIGANELEKLRDGYYFGGLQKFDGNKWIDYRPHPNGEYNPNAIVSNRIEHIICDQFGNLLIATSTEWKYPYNLSFFRNGNWKNLTSTIDGFPVNIFIRDIKIDKNNRVWLATQKGVISFYYTFS
jgi:ligand-binding sensor domain-containing protein